jgi:hypothetical protein
MTLVETIRDLLAAAGNAGASVGDMLPSLRPLVPSDQAAKAAARLVRAGHFEPDGVRRVVADRLNGMASRGELTVRGGGDDRRYFTTDPTSEATMTGRPKAKREVIPLDRLTFDVRLQQRAGLGANGYDEDTVQGYVAARADLGAELPPLKAVWEEAARTYWVYGGFHTGETLRRCGANGADVLVTAGTFADALFYSLAENGGHGKARTTADKQKALTTLFDSRDLLARVLDAAGDEGGVIRGLAAAVQVSKGMVTGALAARGLRATRDGRLVKAEPKAAPPTPPSAKPSPPPPVSPPAPGKAPAPAAAAPDTTARATPDADHVERQEADPSPGAGEADPPPSQAPEWIQPALAERVRFDRLIGSLTLCLHELDRVSSGPAGTFLRKVLGADGEAFVREMRVKRGQSTTLVYTLPPLLWLVRLLKRARPEKVCDGCNGDGCSCCRDAGILPANLDLLPVAGETGDLFDTAELRDVWDA